MSGTTGRLEGALDSFDDCAIGIVTAVVATGTSIGGGGGGGGGGGATKGIGGGGGGGG